MRLGRGWIEEDVTSDEWRDKNGWRRDTRQMRAAMKLFMSPVGCIAAFG
jgi:hypothetical protein